MEPEGCGIKILPKFTGLFSDYIYSVTYFNNWDINLATYVD